MPEAGGESSELQEIFPLRSYSFTSFFRTLYYLFTRHGGLINIAIFGKLFAGLIVLLVRFEYYENASKEFQLLVYSTIWLIVLSVSVISCHIYMKLLWSFEWKLLLEQYRRHGAMFVIQLMSVMLCLGGVSAYTLWQLILKVNVRVEEMEFVLLWRVLFYLTATFRLLQRILATIFIAVVLPVSWRWADQMKTEQKEYLLELLPWKLFLFLHRTLLLTTFLGKPLYCIDIFEDGVHIVSIFFRVFAITWLLILVLYVGYGIAIFPWRMETPGEKEKGKMVTGVIGKLSYPPKSMLVTGISYWHFLFKQEESPVIQRLNESVETRGNAVLHRQLRIMYHELS